MAEEMRFHLEMCAEDKVREGLPSDKAWLAAQKKFGNVCLIQENARDGFGFLLLEQLFQDMRFGVRALGRRIGFTVVVVLTLALGIGANSAIFSVINAILLKPYPWPDSERLVYVHNTFSKMGGNVASISVPDYLDHRAGVPSLAESALITGFSANLSAEGSPERVYGLMVTPSLFPLLQTKPVLGRAFTDAEAELGAPKTVVLNDAFWKNRFARDPAIIGKTIRLNGEVFTVIGVMPPGFYFPSMRAQFFAPFVFTERQKSEAERIMQFATMIARLKPGATLEQAQREIDAVHRAARERLPELREEYEATGYGSVILGFLEFNVRDVRAMLWLLQAGVAATLLIGCANVANLLLSRANARQREFAIRAALGAGRGRLIRQLFTENLVLFLLGGVVGVLVAYWSLGAVNQLGVASLPRGFGVELDLRVLVFTLLSVLFTGLVFGALPAWSATRSKPVTPQVPGARATSARRQTRLSSVLAVTQIALSLMLLATAGLLIKSFQRIQNESPGFSNRRALTGSLSLPPVKYTTPEQRAVFVAQLIVSLQAVPGVSEAGVTNSVPFSGGNPQSGYEVENLEIPAGQANPHGMVRQVSPGYFRALGIPLLRGRLMEPSDTLGRENVVVIDQILADRFWRGADPIGKRVRRGGTPTNPWSTIVGVVATVKPLSLDQRVTKETLYFPYAQAPVANLTLVVKTDGDPATFASAVRQAVLAVDPEQPVYDLKTVDMRIAESLESQRAPMLLLSLFAGMALVIASVGIYGVLAFSVGQRTREFGIRLALGAARAQILRLVLRDGTILILFGVGFGLAGYFASSAVIGKFLFGVAATDPATLMAAPLLLALVAFVACLIPARRATKVDPIVALRAE